jgi:ClpP class serine protease
MDFSIILWAFVIFILLQPLLKQLILERLRQRKISQIERARRSRVILLIHREERLTLLGLPIVRYLDMSDSEEVMRAIQLTDPNMPLDVILHTPGGLYLAATQIALALSGHKGKVTVFVPHYAMSGGTLIALAADEILMCRHSVLGPLEPQVEGLPAVSLLRVVDQKPIAEIDDETLILADIAQKALAQLEQTTTRLLAVRMEETRAAELAKTFTNGRWTHDYAITANEARALGLPVRIEMPPEVLELLALYPQPIRGMPSVEYLPSPHSRNAKMKR